MSPTDRRWDGVVSRIEDEIDPWTSGEQCGVAGHAGCPGSIRPTIGGGASNQRLWDRSLLPRRHAHMTERARVGIVNLVRGLRRPRRRRLRRDDQLGLHGSKAAINRFTEATCCGGDLDGSPCSPSRRHGQDDMSQAWRSQMYGTIRILAAPSWLPTDRVHRIGGRSTSSAGGTSAPR